jgi:hypothetical protein
MTESLAAKGCKVTLVHGPDSEDVETFDDLHAAMDWAGMKGSEYHTHIKDCLQSMKEVFVMEYGSTLQYGTNYHWVTFEKI